MGAEQDDILSSEAKHLREERLRNMDSPTTVTFVEKVLRSESPAVPAVSPSKRTSSARASIVSRPSASQNRQSFREAGSPGGARRAQSMASMSRGESTSFDEEDSRPRRPSFANSLSKKFPSPFKSTAKIAASEDVPFSPEGSALETILDVTNTSNTTSSAPKHCALLPRSKSCPDLNTGNGISANITKHQVSNDFNVGLAVEEAALQTQGDKRAIYRNRSISHMLPHD